MGFGREARWGLPGFSAATLGAHPDLTRCPKPCQAMRAGGGLGVLPRVQATKAVTDS